MRLDREFFARPALTVAHELVGARLVRLENGRRLAGIVTETEAYSGEEDLGCHCKAGLTPRTAVMYGPPGHAYVYFTYGMHWMLNCVVAQEGYPAAILIRALRPTEGLEIIAGRRAPQPSARWTDGPAKLCQALNIDKSLNGADLCAPEAALFFEAAESFPDASVTKGPRVGLNSVPEPWKSIPWRFLVTYE
ncbi:MAG TPA: DNA-3-methyladenine glycosylase [Anaerolineales bacterium]|nr:DNA-3-methyladenine glycosylase [Anaerolineales bacterium]